MAIHFNTTQPVKLLEAFKKAINDGHITMWSCDKDGDFTLTFEKWIFKAWFRPLVESEKRLSFYILPPKGASVTAHGYAVFHARMAESLTYRCDSLFTSAEISSYPENKDKVKSSHE